MDIISKICSACEETKPLAEFYLRTGFDDVENPKHYYAECKQCRKTITKEKGRKEKSKPGEVGEKLVIEELRRLGIYAAPGKCSEWKRQDVVIWGCVRVEVKHSRKSEQGYNFGFENQIRGGGVKSNLIVLVCEEDDQFSFHVFRSDYPAFYRKNNQLKTSVQYIPDLNRRAYGVHGQTLTHPVMQEHRDKWELVQEIIQEISVKLSNNEEL